MLLSADIVPIDCPECGEEATLVFFRDSNKPFLLCLVCRNALPVRVQALTGGTGPDAPPAWDALTLHKPE